jgi:hypothetical protein
VLESNRSVNMFTTVVNGELQHFSKICPALGGLNNKASDPLMVGIRSPDGLVAGSCTSLPGVLGSIPKREEPGKTGRHPVLRYRVPHGSHH